MNYIVNFCKRICNKDDKDKSMKMKFSEAIDRTLDTYSISAKWLSEQSGVSQQMISQFRKGKQRVYSDSLEAIITALPFDAKQYLFSLLLGEQLPSINFLNDNELSEVLETIAGILRKKTVERELIHVKSHAL